MDHRWIFAVLSAQATRGLPSFLHRAPDKTVTANANALALTGSIPRFAARANTAVATKLKTNEMKAKIRDRRDRKWGYRSAFARPACDQQTRKTKKPGTNARAVSVVIPVCQRGKSTFDSVCADRPICQSNRLISRFVPVLLGSPMQAMLRQH